MKALMRLSHHIVVLHEGKKIAEGVPEAVANNPLVIKAYLGERRDVHPA
jgi:branched-chain amino acid transport system ATP-binding protein